jgi:hypothetical protein
MDPHKQRERRAIEALRSGVPNRDAVSVLDCNQNEIKDIFLEQLHDIKNSDCNKPKHKSMLIKGGFGRGKSHLLEYLQHLAVDENFICSKVVISKETPLYDPVKLFRAAADTAIIPGKRGSAIAEVAEELIGQKSKYDEFLAWSHSIANEISPIFAATVFLLPRLNREPERRDRIIRFWAGEKFGIGEVRKYLRECGEAVSYRIEQFPLRELSLQRFRFIPRLMQTVGYSGWVILIDEIELIGNYSFRQRAKSYAELARWMGQLKDGNYSGLATVLAITEDFQSAILEDKNDLENIPGKLKALAVSDSQRELADQAEKGMRTILRNSFQLIEPNEDFLRQTLKKVCGIYSRAYGWDPPLELSLNRDIQKSMRVYIREWITEWDLKRLYPNYSTSIEIGELRPVYVEDPDLEPKEETD